MVENYWISRGAEKGKLVLGIPFYGRGYTIKESINSPNDLGGRHFIKNLSYPGEYTKTPGVLSYREIEDRIKKDEWNYKHGPVSARSMAGKADQWISYDDQLYVK